VDRVDVVDVSNCIAVVLSVVAVRFCSVEVRVWLLSWSLCKLPVAVVEEADVDAVDVSNWMAVVVGVAAVRFPSVEVRFWPTVWLVSLACSP